MQVLISKKTNIYYYYNESGDFHCKEGQIKESDLKSDKKIVKSNIDREFLKFKANKHDEYLKMKRGPQIITPKDIGYVLTRTGIDKNSYIVEAGGGSGGATSMFSKFANKVKTYEIKEDNSKIIQKNIDKMELDNVELLTADLKDHISKEKDIDLLFLDMPEPNLILEEDLSGIKEGNYIVCYVPSINQVQDVVNLVQDKEDLYYEEVSEVILRNWKISERVSRPESRKDIDHTAFLVFIRKI